MNQSVVQLRGITKTYRIGRDITVNALRGIDLDIGAAEFVAIMGPSGSGKSTLMNVLGCLDVADGGTYVLAGENVGKLSDNQLAGIRNKHVGFVFQTYNLLPALTAADNITLPLDIAGRSADRAWLDTVVGTVGLGSRLRHRPAELPGGQQQRVAIARALAGRPEIIFADEPTGNLDSRAGAEVLDLLRRCVREFGQTIVMVTHDPAAACYADRVVFLTDGRIADQLDQPDPQAVLDRMAALQARSA